MLRFHNECKNEVSDLKKQGVLTWPYRSWDSSLWCDLSNHENQYSFKVCIYVCIFGCAGSSLLCTGLLGVVSEGHRLVVVPGLLIALASPVAVTGSGHLAQQLQFMDSRAWTRQAAVAHGLSCPSAFESSWTRIKPMSPSLAADS